MPATLQERRHRVCSAHRKTRPSIILGTSVLTCGLLGAGVPVVTAIPIPPLANTPVQDAHHNGVGTADVAHQFSSAPTPSQELHWRQTRPDGATQSGLVVHHPGRGIPVEEFTGSQPLAFPARHTRTPRAQPRFGNVSRIPTSIPAT